MFKVIIYTSNVQWTLLSFSLHRASFILSDGWFILFLSFLLQDSHVKYKPGRT